MFIDDSRLDTFGREVTQRSEIIASHFSTERQCSGHAQVQNLDIAIRGDSNVLRRQLAVNQRPQLPISSDGYEAMRIFEESAELDADFCRLCRRNRPAQDYGRQIFSVEIFHRNVVT